MAQGPLNHCNLGKCILELVNEKYLQSPLVHLTLPAWISGGSLLSLMGGTLVTPRISFLFSEEAACLGDCKNCALRW